MASPNRTFQVDVTYSETFPNGDLRISEYSYPYRDLGQARTHMMWVLGEIERQQIPSETKNNKIVAFSLVMGPDDDSGLPTSQILDVFQNPGAKDVIPQGFIPQKNARPPN